MSKIAGKFTPGIYNVVVSETQAIPLKDGKGMKVRLRFVIVLPQVPLTEISMTWKIQGLESFEDLKWNLSQLGVWIDHYDGIAAACTDVVDRAAFAYIDSRRKVRLLHEDNDRLPPLTFWNRLSRAEVQRRYAELGLEQFLGQTNELDKCRDDDSRGNTPGSPKNKPGARGFLALPPPKKRVPKVAHEAGPAPASAEKGRDARRPQIDDQVSGRDGKGSSTIPRRPKAELPVAKTKAKPKKARA